jgi:TetR/AcrR family transcriptional regulator
MPSSDSEPGSKRGRTHDAVGAREAILNAAEEVFAEHGFDGARIDSIAKSASYNKSLIFQYFDNKLSLYGEVIRRADAQTRDIQTQVLVTLLEDKQPLSKHKVEMVLGDVVGAYFDYLLHHPRVARIFVWEMAEGWQTYSKIVSQQDFDDVAQFGPVLEKLRSAGLLRSDLNLLLQMSSALFVCHNYLALIPMYRILTPTEDLSSDEALARGRAFVVQFIIHGMLTDSAETRSDTP